jgi:hypothetical protein
MTTELFKIHHGIKLADNSEIYNLEIEKLINDPNPIRIGRIWYNRIDKLFKYTTLDENNNIVIEAFASLESISSTILESHNITYNPLSSSNQYFNIPENTTVDTAINLITTQINNLYSKILTSRFIEYFYITSQIDNITLTKEIHNKNNLVIIINGLEQSESSYSITTNNKTIHFTDLLPPNSVIKIINLEILL